MNSLKHKRLRKHSQNSGFIHVFKLYNLKQHHDIDGFVYFVAINSNFNEDENYLDFNNVHRVHQKEKKCLIKYIA